MFSSSNCASEARIFRPKSCRGSIFWQDTRVGQRNAVQPGLERVEDDQPDTFVEFMLATLARGVLRRIGMGS